MEPKSITQPQTEAKNGQEQGPAEQKKQQIVFKIRIINQLKTMLYKNIIPLFTENVLEILDVDSDGKDD